MNCRYVQKNYYIIFFYALGNVFRYYNMAAAVYLRRRYCTCRIKNNDKPHKSDKGARKQRYVIIILCVWAIVFLLFALDGRIKYRVNTNQNPQMIILHLQRMRHSDLRDKDVREGKAKK